MKELKIAVGINVKKFDLNINKSINSCPENVLIIIVASEVKQSRPFFAENKIIKIIQKNDEVEGYDLVRNRRIIYDEFVKEKFDLLLYLDDDEYFPKDVSEFLDFYKSPATVGMIAHSNVLFGKKINSSGKNYHARLIKPNGFPLTGSIIEGVRKGEIKMFLNTRITHDFYRNGFEHFIFRSSRWAKESAKNESESMRVWVGAIRNKIGIISPFFRFFYHYIYLRGFLEGRLGYYVAMNFAISEYLRELYKFEMQKNQNEPRK